MKLVAVSGDFQDLLDVLIGTESFFMMMYDDPVLLDELIQRWFSAKLSLYETVLARDSVGAIFTCADLGSKNSTLVSPEFIKTKLIPWYKKYGNAAHEAGKMFWFHCCGNIYKQNVIELLIDEARIDAFHSFQDVILPVTEFVRRYGKRVAAFGGIDLDKLCSLGEKELRQLIRSTLDSCMATGRYALGTGNSVASYVPLKNWLILLEEAGIYSV